MYGKVSLGKNTDYTLINSMMLFVVRPPKKLHKMERLPIKMSIMQMPCVCIIICRVMRQII